MNRIGKWALYVALWVVAIVQVYPLIWLLLFSFKSNQEIYGASPFALPSEFRWENYSMVWDGGIGIYFFNSVWITATAVILTVLLASMVTFAITRLRWKLSGLVLGLFMIGLMIPFHSSLIPLFSMYLEVNLIDNPLSLVLTYTTYNMPLTIMILLGFYKTIPHEIEEAAIIDGCSINRLFFRIVLPMSLPIMSTTAIINMIYNWNEFVFVNTFISSEHLKTLTVGIQNFIGQHSTEWGPIGATLIISVLPLLVAFIFFSNKIVEGLSASAVKG